MDALDGAAAAHCELHREFPGAEQRRFGAAADLLTGRPQPARRLQLLIRQRRTAGPENRRRVRAAADAHPVVRDLHGQSRCDQRGGAGEHPVALPPVERRLDVEPRAAVVDFQAIHDERVEHELSH